MKISNIRIHRFNEQEKLKAVVTVTFDNFIVIRDIQIVDKGGSFLVVMPFEKLPTGEFRDICHPITPEFRNYLREAILDLYNSNESEKVFEEDFSEPQIEYSVKLIDDSEANMGSCSMILDNVFAVHKIMAVKIKETGKLTITFPNKKTKADKIHYLCEIIKNEDKYYREIIDTFIKAIEEKNQSSSNYSESININSDDGDEAPGWDAITAEVERIYPNQKNPKHYGPIIKYWLGGKDPIDGISVYDGGDYWHFVTYGMSELYKKETPNKDISGYGMEFTFKLKKENYENEENEIKNICGILQSFAKITFSKGEIFNEYEYIYSGQTEGIDVNRKSNLTGFITIPDNDFKPIETPNGKVKFVEFIGVTDAELKAILNKKIRVKELYEKIGKDITDYHRKSVFGNDDNDLSKNEQKQTNIVKNEKMGFEIEIPTDWKVNSDEEKNNMLLNNDLTTQIFRFILPNNIEMSVSAFKLNEKNIDETYNKLISLWKESGANILTQNIIEINGVIMRNVFIDFSEKNFWCQIDFEKEGYWYCVNWLVSKESQEDMLQKLINSDEFKVTCSLKKGDSVVANSEINNIKENTVVSENEFSDKSKAEDEKNNNKLNSANQKDYYEQLIERLNAGNSEKNTYDFDWDSTLLLNYADESSIEIAYNLIERGKISLSTDDKKEMVHIKSLLYGFCDANMSNEEYFKKYENNKKYNERKEESTWKVIMNKPSIGSYNSCHKCRYQSCPKVLAAYILYLKNQGKLKEKLIEREKFRKENNVENGFFFFEWKSENGLRKIDDKSFEFAKRLVDNDYIRVERTLKDKNISIISLITCKDIQVSNMDFTKLTVKRDWNKTPISLSRKVNFEPNLLCKPYTCRLPSCALVVAGYIYYLKMTGQESKIKEDREHYLAHKEEIDKEIEDKVKNKIESLKNEKEEKIQKIKDSYEGKIENLNLTINNILESNLSNFHCIVVGDDDGEKNGFIEKVIRLLKEQNPKIEDVRRLPVKAFTDMLKYDARVTINRNNKLVYSDISKEEDLKIPVKRDEKGFAIRKGIVHRVTDIEKNAIYVLNDLKEFISYVRSADDTYKSKYRIKIDIEALTNIASSNYIIIDAKQDEVDSFLALSQRLKFVYQNNIITLPTYSIDNMFETYINLLNADLVEQLRENEEEYRKHFSEYVSVNKNFMPFNKKEMINYIATFANVRNELILPPNLYKKENLDKLIGLDDVKEKLKEFEKYMLFQIQAKANDIDIGASNMHMIFTGNPGTGKTTVARIMAKMLFDLGIIKENKLVEVERKDLIAKYVGQTAIKTSEVIERAIGGVLFIDEAYTLANTSDYDFGKEAIATLIKAMEDYKDNLIVIFAGYRNEMKKFTDINPGISSRIGYTFDFEDYSVNELMQIFYTKLKNSGFECEEEIDVPLKRLCDYFSKRKNFGNGRFVDKVIQETLMKHALRNSDNIRLIKQDDIPTIEELNQNVYKNNNSETAEEMLSGIIGMENVKNEILQFRKYVDFIRKAQKKNITIPDSNMHMIFTGNPGTGKTTIARIIAKMLFDMEVIHEDKLIEVERKDLVGESQGKTAPKTSDIIEKAMGGVLFIDEAYSLVNSHGGRDQFGEEAVATLIKAMEDHKGEFVVIFAGYRDEMKKFIDINPGIASRIGYTFNFEDYSVKELMEMFYLKMKKYGFECKENTEVVLKRICEYYSRRKNFGNGRFVDKVIQKTLVKHANRSAEEVEIITEEDIPTIEELNQNTIKNTSNIEELLSNIVGMKDLKEEILSFGKYIAFVKEAEKQKIKIPDSNKHMIFTGNPGTGKTTIARIIAKMLFDMDVIHENKLIEVERKDLVAGWIGQTALKTAEVIEKAMGGVLFIDEAYTLSVKDGKDFASEAIATLIKAMEDHKGELVVIFAGYREEMKEFVDSNPGIASRIGYTFNFKDYEPDELTEIFVKKIKNTGMTMTDDANEAVLKVMRYFSNVENFGNGRFVDKVFHQTITKHSKALDRDILVITKDDIPEINEMTSIMLGGEKMIDVRKITDEALRKTAVHEVGHATAKYLLCKESRIKKITINAEGRGFLGYVRSENWNGSYTPGKTTLLNDIMIKLAGLACEKVYFGEYESGGSSDLENATAIAYNMITRLGMSDLGLAKIKNPNGEIAKIIWEEENKILKQCFEKVEKLLSENKEKIDKVVEYLIEKTEINEEEFIKKFNGFGDVH